MNIGLHLRIFILRDMKTRNCVGPFIICCAPCSSSPITCQTNEALFMCFKEHTLQEHFLWHWDIFIFLMSLDNSHFMGVTVQKALRYEVLCMNGYNKTDLKVSGAGTCTKIELIFRSDKRKKSVPLNSPLASRLVCVACRTITRALATPISFVCFNGPSFPTS